MIQMSAAVVEDGQARMIPVIFNDASTPVKPRKGASAETWTRYKEESKARCLSVLGTECLHEMRSRMEPERDLWVAVDGSYTNRTVLNHLPDKTTLIGRIRSDAKLYYPPTDDRHRGAGRKRLYGLAAPTPEEVRTNESIAWQPVQAYASGKLHEFKVKVIKNSHGGVVGKQDCSLLNICSITLPPEPKDSPVLPRSGLSDLYRPGYLCEKCARPTLGGGVSRPISG